MNRRENPAEPGVRNDGKNPMKKIFALLIALAAPLLVAQTALAQDGYRIRSGDVLTVEVVQDPSLNRDVLVLPDGSISFPFAGSLRVRGLTTGQVQAQLAQGVASNFAVAPTVFVSVREIFVPEDTGEIATGPTIDIYIQGEVGAPGLFQVRPGTTLMQALSLPGGFTNFAATRRIQLRRIHPHTGQISVYTLDYRAIESGAMLNSDPVLAQGDVILVPERRLFE